MVVIKVLCCVNDLYNPSFYRILLWGLWFFLNLKTEFIVFFRVMNCDHGVIIQKLLKLITLWDSRKLTEFNRLFYDLSRY